MSKTQYMIIGGELYHSELSHSSLPSIKEALAYRKIKVGSRVKYNDWGDVITGTVVNIDHASGRVTVSVSTVNGEAQKALTKSYIVPSQKANPPLRKQPKPGFSLYR